MRDRSLASDAAWNTTSFAVRMIGTIVSLSWVARALGPDGQGRFGFAHWIAIIGGQVALWGLGLAVTRFVAQQIGAGRPAEAAAAASHTWRWLKKTLLWGLAIGLPAAALAGGELRLPLLLAVPYAAAIAACGWRIGLAHGLRRFDVVLASDVLFYGLLMPALAVGLGADEPIAGTMAAWLFARAASLVLLHVWTERLVSELAAGAGAEAVPPAFVAELRRYAVQMALLTLLGAVLWERTELTFLKARSSYEQIGWFTAAAGLSILVTRVPGVLGQVMLPLVAEMHGGAAGDHAIGTAFRRGARLMSLLVVGPVCVGIAASPAVVQVLFEDEYEPAAKLLRILLVPMLLTGVGAMGSKTLVGAGGHGALVRLTMWMACLKIWLCIALVPRWGAAGAAVAVAGAQTLGLAAEGWLAARRFPVAEGSPGPRWLEQLGVGAWATGATLAAGFLIGGAARGTDPHLALAVQLGAGLLGAALAARIYRPLPADDAAALLRNLPEPVRQRVAPVLEWISG